MRASAFDIVSADFSIVLVLIDDAVFRDSEIQPYKKSTVSPCMLSTASTHKTQFL